jgi:hypothetical protein
LAFVVAGLAAGYSGLAIIGTIVTGMPLVVLEAALVLVPIGATVLIVRQSPPRVVHEIRRVVVAGLIAGFAATLAYDVTRTALSYLDPSPYNPFEAIRQFGIGLVTDAAPLPAIMVAGLAIHAVNGSTFGVIYAVFGGRHIRSRTRALAAGLAWGLMLELVQSALYPGWLRITTVLQEFLFISSVGHLAYGATLGLGVRRLLAPTQPMEVGDV